MAAYLLGVRGYVPDQVCSNDDLVRDNPGWDAEKIFAKTGIRERRVAAPTETAADLGFRAASQLLEDLHIDRNGVNVLLFCTESPDYLLPPTACLLQTRLGLPTTCAALDFNLGCSGFVYGLWLAKSLVESQAAQNVLLVVGDTYTKFCNPHDLVTATIFGDGGGAALISSESQNALALLGPTVLGSDGRGADNLIVRAGGARRPRDAETAIIRKDNKGNLRSDEQLFMNGPEIYTFTLTRVSSGIQQLLDRSGLDWNQIDLFLFHQANAYMLEQLQKKMDIPPAKMPVRLERIGNTVSASIPLLIAQCQEEGLFHAKQRCVLASFGVGYSWAFSLLEWMD